MSQSVVKNVMIAVLKKKDTEIMVQIIIKKDWYTFVIVDSFWQQLVDLYVFRSSIVCGFEEGDSLEKLRMLSYFV